MNNNIVTKEEVQECLKEVETITVTLFGKKITVSSVKLSNGFLITETSTCVDPANYVEAYGEAANLKRLESRAWELLGYELMSKLNGM